MHLNKYNNIIKVEETVLSFDRKLSYGTIKNMYHQELLYGIIDSNWMVWYHYISRGPGIVNKELTTRLIAHKYYHCCIL